MRIYFDEEDKDLVQSAIDLLADNVFDQWTIKPSFEIEEDPLYHDNETCVKIEYINSSMPSEQYWHIFNLASDLTYAFINGYIQGLKSKSKKGNKNEINI
jgi:hypothetical protein